MNEMTWYAAKGDPRWDADELWITMGHLYQGGMWFKKKAVLQVEGHYDTEKSVDGTDWRINNGGNSWSVSQTLPSTADANKYFYLPALGDYDNGRQKYVGSHDAPYGMYWSSSANPEWSGLAYDLSFDSGNVNVYGGNRLCGFRVGGFE